MTSTNPPSPTFPRQTGIHAKYFKLPEDAVRKELDTTPVPEFYLRDSRQSAPMTPETRAFIISMNKSKLGVAEPLAQLQGRHPEQRTDEVYLGNYYVTGLHRCGWKTKRAGCYAYRRDGSHHPDLNFVPVFIARAEAEQAGLSIEADCVASPKAPD